MVTPLRRLNGQLGTTVIVVTHNPAVARRTDRILVMGDGRIVDQHIVGKPFEEHLAAFRRSGLGRALISGDSRSLSDLTLAGIEGLKQLLNEVP